MWGRVELAWADGEVRPLKAEGVLAEAPSLLRRASKKVAALKKGLGMEWTETYAGRQLRLSLFPLSHEPRRAVLIAIAEPYRDWRDELFDVLETFRQRLAEAEAPEAVYRALVTAAVRAIPGAEAGSFWLRQSKSFELVAVEGFPERLVGTRIGLEAQQQWFAAEGDAPWVNPAPARTTRLPASARKDAAIERIQATLTVPIRVQGRIYGYLNLDSFSDPEAFGPAALKAARVFAGQAAALVAVYERERLKRFEAERRRWLIRVGRLGAALRRMPQKDPLDWARAVLMREFSEVRVEPLALEAVPEALRPELFAQGVVFREGVAYLRVPGAERVLVFYPREEGRFPAGFSGFLAAFLEGLKLAGERNHALQEARQKSEAYRQLLTISNLLESETNPDRIIRETLELLLAITRTDTGIFTRLEGDRLRPAYLSGSFSREMLRAYQEHPPRLGEGAVGEALAFQRFLAVEDYENWPGAIEVFRRLGLKSVYVVPIWLDNKPFGAVELLSFRRQALSPAAQEVFKLAGRRMMRMLERAEHLRELEANREAILRTFGLALEHRDLETQGHTDRVVRLATALGRRLGYRGAWLKALRWGAYLHDVGKLALPDAILLKPTGLLTYEWESVKRHPLLGVEMLKNLTFLPEATLNIVRYHHERWDGSGYPEGLKGHEIPEEARIFAVVDVFDALVSPRPYKEAWDQERALAELERQAGKTLDPDAVAAFIGALKSGDLALPPAG